jgi:hypothetical protein
MDSDTIHTRVAKIKPKLLKSLQIFQKATPSSLLEGVMYLTVNDRMRELDPELADNAVIAVETDGNEITLNVYILQ